MLLFPSSNLLDKVLGIPNNEIKSISLDGTILIIQKSNNQVHGINLFEFVQKCKQWALIVFDIRVDEYSFRVELINSMQKELFKIYEDHTPYSPFRIISACEWILNNKANS